MGLSEDCMRMLVWGVSTSLGVPGLGVCSLEPSLRVPLPHLHLTPSDSRSDFRFLENARQGWGVRQRWKFTAIRTGSDVFKQ